MIRRDLAGRRTAGEDAVDAELGRHGLVEARAADDQQRALVLGVGLAEGRRHLAGVEQVGVALGDDLGDQDGVGLLLAGALDELGHGDLGAEVHDLELAVVLQALLAREPLDVEDRVDADRVGVGADAAADDDQAAPQRALDRGVGLLGRQQRVVALDDLDGAGVDQVVHAAVDDEEGEALPHRLGVHDQGRVHAHLVGELDGRALGDLGVLDRQGEAELHHAVAGGVAVRADRARRDLLTRPPGSRTRGCSSRAPCGPRPRGRGPCPAGASSGRRCRRRWRRAAAGHPRSPCRP